MAIRLTRGGKAIAPVPVCKPTNNDTPELTTLESDPTLPGGFLRQSMVKTFLQCPYRFYLRYVEGRVSPPSLPMVEGLSHHHWLERENQQRIQTAAVLSNAEAIGTFEADFAKRSQEIGDWDGDDKDRVMGRAKSIVHNYHEFKARKIHPIKAEHRFEMMVGDVPVLGTIDLIEVGDRVSDYKVSSRHKTTRDIENDIQLPLYASAVEGQHIRFISVDKKTSNPTDQVKFIDADVKRSAMAWAQTVVSDSANAIRHGVFPKTSPDNWWCSKKFCGYWHMCRGARKPPEMVNRFNGHK